MPLRIPQSLELGLSLVVVCLILGNRSMAIYCHLQHYSRMKSSGIEVVHGQFHLFFLMKDCRCRMKREMADMEMLESFLMALSPSNSCDNPLVIHTNNFAGRVKILVPRSNTMVTTRCNSSRAIILVL